MSDAASDTSFDHVFRRYRRDAVLLHRPYPPYAGRRTNSKFGGLPNLPAHYHWPRTPAGTPLHFLAQIDCADITFPTPLPERGVLFFFGRDDEEQVWDEEDPAGNCRVLYALDAFAATPPREVPADLPPIGGICPRPMWYEYLRSHERPALNVHIGWPIQPLPIDTWPGVPPGEADPKFLSLAVYARHLLGLRPRPQRVTSQEAEARRQRYTERHEQLRAKAFTTATGEQPELDWEYYDRVRRAEEAVFFHADHGPEAYPQYWITIHYAARAVLRQPIMMAYGRGDREVRMAQAVSTAEEWLRRSNEVGLQEPVSEEDRAAFRAWLMSVPPRRENSPPHFASQIVFLSLVPTIRAWAGDPHRAALLPPHVYAAMRFRFEGGNYSQMLGHAPSAQEPLPPDDPTICLLNLPSDHALGWSFGDAGNCTFWITPQDLARRDFSKVWGTIVGH